MSYSKSSKRERENEVLKIQQERENDELLKIQQERERENDEVLKIQQEREREKRSRSSSRSSNACCLCFFWHDE